MAATTRKLGGAFDQVSRGAESLGVRVSEFIREAALEKASRQAEGVALTSLSGPFTGSIFFNGRIACAPPGITRVTGSVQFPDETFSPSEQTIAHFFNEPTTV